MRTCASLRENSTWNCLRIGRADSEYLCYLRAMVLDGGPFCSSFQGRVLMCRDIFGFHSWADATGSQWAEVRDDANGMAHRKASNLN